MTPALVAVAAAARTAGWVVAVGSLIGYADSTVVWVLAALTLIGFGRSLTAASSQRWIPVAAVIVMGVALVAATLRWSALDLASIRGAQSVIGPSVAVGTERAATGAALALAGLLGAGSVFVGREGRLAVIADTLLVGLAAVALFLVPSTSGDFGSTAALWAGATGAIALVVGIIGTFVARRRRWVLPVMALSAVCTIAGVGLTVVG